MTSQLIIRRGSQVGRVFDLDTQRPLHVGRGSTCEVSVTDPLASRFHAAVFFQDGQWQIRDTSSRNGTLVDGVKIEEAALNYGSTISIGGTDFELVTAGDESTRLGPGLLDDDLTKTIQVSPREVARNGRDDPPGDASPIAKSDELYQLSLDLLSLDDPQAIVDAGLTLIHQSVGADVSAISMSSGDGRKSTKSGDSKSGDARTGRMRLRKSIPEKSGGLTKLNRVSTQRVIRRGESIWLRTDADTTQVQDAGGPVVDDRWNDAILVPLGGIEETGNDGFGVLHLYRRNDEFEAVDFEFAKAACRLLTPSLERATLSFAQASQNQQIRRSNAIADVLVGESPPIKRLMNQVKRLGPASGSVLIRGESGAGKELVASAVHAASLRAGRPMLTVNCAAIPASLIESQLFGHKKGSFTGADTDHIGYFARADGGTLFLDEIGELPLEGQAKLLRILEGHPFLTVGGTDEINVDVRVIAATNRDLLERVKERKFREDLYYRLSVFELVVPPLRERGPDVRRLIDHFFDHFRIQHGRSDLKISAAAMQTLESYLWPGNVRQLRNVIDSAVVMADDPEITPDDLGIQDIGVSHLETLRLDVWEKKLIMRALQRVDGSVAEACKLLGVARATLYRKISEHDIDRQTI